MSLAVILVLSLLLLTSSAIFSSNTIIPFRFVNYAQGFSYYGASTTATTTAGYALISVMTTENATTTVSNYTSDGNNLTANLDNLSLTISNNKTAALLPSTDLSENASSTLLGNKTLGISMGNKTDNVTDSNNITQPLGLRTEPGGEKIPNQYIITMKSTASDSELQSLISKAKGDGAEILHTYNFEGFKGFAIKTPDKQTEDRVLQILKDDPNVASLAPDITMEAQ